MILPNRCLLKLNLLKIKIYWMKTDIKYILSASVWKAMSRLRGKDWLRTQMLRSEWLRSKWITNFPSGEDAGQRLRNEAEYLTVDVTNFLLLWSTSSQMQLKVNNKPSLTCVNSSFKIISISIILKVEFVGAHCGLLLPSLVPWLSWL